MIRYIHKNRPRGSNSRIAAIATGKKLSERGYIWYTMDSIATLTNGSSIILNENRIGFNASLHTGQACEFTSTQYVDVPIVHQLGSEEYTGGLVKGNTANGTAITDGYNLSVTSETRLIIEGTSASSGFILLEFNAVINSGSCTILSAYDGTSFNATGLPYTIVNGLNKVVVTSNTQVGSLCNFDVSTSTFNIDFTAISVKQITTTNSHLTHFDYATNEYITADNSLSTPTTTKRFELGTYSHAFTTTVPVTSADLTYLNAHTEAATAVAKGGTDSNLSFVTADIANFWPMTDGTVAGGTYMQDIMVDYGAELVTNGGFDTDTDWTKSTGWTISGGTAINDGLSRNAIYQSGALPTSSYAVLTIDVLQSNIDIYTFNPVFTKKAGFSGAGTYNVILEGGDTRLYIYPTTIGDNPIIDNISVKEVSAVELTNYASTQWTNAAQLTTGPQTARYKIDSTRRVTAMADAGTIEFHGQEKAVIPTQSNTADLSVTATPRVLAGNLLSGAATIDTTGMTVAVESTKTLTAEVISGTITIGDGFDGAISEFKETL